ncbi:uncharacterized protein LOC117341512 [Pecten maximus]|uniref:uncharacterized protein LOC117341512 n=1 Tax=Pecten maximus TaxID=6579 RepID=UPI0014584D43|nr:uncharacterized protein LOC117341512 [Pecten maximus]
MGTYSYSAFCGVLLLSLSYSAAIRCLSCTDVLQPRYCSGIEHCSEGDACVTESYRNRNGEILYNLGCMFTQRCALNALHNRSTEILHQDIIGTHVHDVCTECCHGDLCNAAGCGSTGFPQQRGPICFDCPQSRDPANCDVISVCLQGEVCHVEEVLMFDDVFYKTSCVRKNDYECTPPSVYNQVAIGRRANRRGNCFYCCTDDLCNTKCYRPISSSLTTIPSTSQVTPYTTTTSTTTMVTQPTCKDGWITSPEKCYYVSATFEKTDWETAKHRCISMGAKLVEIKTDEEGQFLLHSMPPRIGNASGDADALSVGRRWNDAGDLVFDSNDDRVNTTVRSWAVLPNKGKFKCGCIRKYNNFLMIGCVCTSGTFFYICEISR